MLCKPKLSIKPAFFRTSFTVLLPPILELSTEGGNSTRICLWIHTGAEQCYEAEESDYKGGGKGNAGGKAFAKVLLGRRDSDNRLPADAVRAP